MNANNLLFQTSNSSKPERKKIVFVDLWSHTKSQAVDFLIELLKRRFDVDVRYVHSRYDKDMVTKEEIKKYDAAVYFQVSPSNVRARSFGKPQIYVPMYDAETFNKARWRRIGLQHGSAICFSGRHTVFLTKAGVKCLDVRFYPERQSFSPGNPRKLFLWDRNFVGFRALKSLFRPEQLDEVILRCSEEHARQVSEADRAAYHIKIIPSKRYVSREEYKRLFSDCGLYLAPRRKEGIGMSFLEALSMGKCVIAHDDQTMNEYIRHMENGVLVDYLGRSQLGFDLVAEKILSIQRTAHERCAIGRDKWEKQEDEILDYISREIDNYKAMGLLETIKWWMLLPWHFLWDVRSFFLTRLEPRFRKFVNKRLWKRMGSRSIVGWD